MTASPRKRWHGRIRASVAADAGHVCEVVDTLDELGFSTHLNHAGGRWQVELRRREAPTVWLLHRVAALFEPTIPGGGAGTFVVDMGGRSYRLARQPAANVKHGLMVDPGSRVSLGGVAGPGHTLKAAVTDIVTPLASLASSN